MPQPDNRRRVLGTMLALAGVVIVAVGLVYFFFTPKSYQAAARLKIIDSRQPQSPDQITDLNAIHAECDLLYSHEVADKVISNLHLTDLWTRRYNHATPLGSNETYSLLLSRSFIQPVPNSSLIEIRE